MNKRLLLKVAKHIEANPHSLNMTRVISRSICGTTACIAGWTIELGGTIEDKKKVGWLPYAANLLGISLAQAEVLFYADYWPDPYRTEYKKANTGVLLGLFLTPGEMATNKAKVAVSLIRDLAEDKVKLEDSDFFVQSWS